MNGPAALVRFENPFSSPPGCATCTDLRRISERDYSSKPCPVCGCSCPRRGKDEPPPSCDGCVKSANLKRDAFHRSHSMPTIIELDMTPAELAAFRLLRSLHPNAGKLTAISWIEGQRYEPAKDPAFVAACEDALDVWRRHTGRETKRRAA